MELLLISLPPARFVPCRTCVNSGLSGCEHLPAVTGAGTLAVDPFVHVHCRVVPPLDWACFQTSHGCLTGLASTELAGQSNALSYLCSSSKKILSYFHVINVGAVWLVLCIF